jgi:hypothetical protein
MRSASPYWFVAAVLACTAEKPTARFVAPLPIASSESAARPTPSASAVAAPEGGTPVATRAPVVPPERLPEIDPKLALALGAEGVRRLEVAASVCAPVVFHREGRLRVGCRSCPPFDASTGPDGRIVVDPADDAELYELEALYAGSFTRPGAAEAAAVFAGCEPHAANWGGTLLVERRGAIWVQVSYRSGFHPADCRTFLRPDARHLPQPWLLLP